MNFEPPQAGERPADGRRMPLDETCASSEIVYRIDASSTIVFVSESWNGFFQSNVPPGTRIPEVLGTQLWHHVVDSSTTHLYQAMVAKARQSRRELTVSFRCDSPEKRRFMQLSICPMGAGLVEFRSRLLREESRPFVALLNQPVEGVDQLLRMCGWCKKVFLAHWLEVEEAVRELRLFEAGPPPRITHTICPDCQGRVQAEIDNID